jgi:hypothetical protein
MLWVIYTIISLFCVCMCVCMTGYRLGSWTSYRHETIIIRTSRTWGCATWKKFSRKVTSGQITEQNYFDTNAFLWKIFLYIFLPFILNGPLLVFYKKASHWFAYFSIFNENNNFDKTLAKINLKWIFSS